MAVIRIPLHEQPEFFREGCKLAIQENNWPAVIASNRKRLIAMKWLRKARLEKSEFVRDGWRCKIDERIKANK